MPASPASDPAHRSAGERTPALLATHAAALLFGAAALVGKTDASPLWIVVGRCGIAAVVLGALVWRRGQDVPALRAEWRQLLGVSLLLAVHWLTFFASVKLAGVAVATLSYATFPLFALLLQSLSIRRATPASHLVAGVCIVLGVALLARPESTTGLPTHSRWLGLGTGLLSALSFAWFGARSAPLVRRFGATRVAVVQYLCVVALLAPWLWLVTFPSGADSWLAIVALGVLGTALAHQFYLYGLVRLPTAAAGSIVALEPVYAIALAALIFGEPLGGAVVLAAATILGASWVLLREPN